MFEATVAAVPPDRWSAPSPFANWDARGVVRHVVDMHAAMLGPLGRALSPAPSLEADPLAVPADASKHDRLLGLLGRDPR